MDDDLAVALKALMDPIRLRLAGRLLEAPATTDDLAEALVRPLPEIARHLERLHAAGLVAHEGVGRGTLHSFRISRLNELGRALAALHHRDDDPVDAGVGAAGQRLPLADVKVLRSFFAGDRLTTIPAAPGKRAVVLRYLRERCFAEDRAYPEKEVNQRLALFHPDVASIRRYMVDGGLLTRSGGVYRRGEAGVASAR